MGRDDSSPAGVWAPLLIALILVLFDVNEGPQPQYVGVLTAMPLLAAALTTPLYVALVGATVTTMAFVLGIFQEDVGLSVAVSTPQLTRLSLIVAATVLGVVVARTRQRRTRRMRQLASVADAAQQAILRPLPSMVGPFHCATIYLSATTGASIGGDLVEVLSTPYGVRVIVGDVRGKGLDAVRLAGRVLGSFREVAHTIGDLPTLARTLDRAVRRDAGPEDFVTAMIVELDGAGRVTLCDCGHPAPYVVA
ncbi:MAG TPA: SpoIIE family protein phosphatase, partial [Actinomycetales bacterium]|nr:SpoIIE family protein phosphatase [Actinomycetales bacterium]